MIVFILKNWKFLLDVILVIAVVVLVFLWNPFGIFGGSLKLESTANMVTEVKEIGQLVTAEYYGEVIASVEEARLNLIEEDNLNQEARLLFQDFNLALQTLLDYQSLPVNERVTEYKTGPSISNWRRIIRHSVNSRNITDKLNYHDLLTDVESDPLYNDLLEYVWRKKSGRIRNDQWDPSPRNKEEALFLYYKELENGIVEEWNETEFRDFYYRNKESKITKSEARKKLSMIGRGWVKAGFDFSHLDASSIVIHESLGEVHIIGLSPKILNADINPWFIPEKGIPGFEILDENGQVDFRDANKVKQYCVDKLLVYARRADILKNAERQGEETLKSLFSLITGKEIRKVVFHNDRIIQFAQDVESDERVTYFEASLLDSLMEIEIGEIDSLRNVDIRKTSNQHYADQKEKNISIFLQRLQKLPFQDTEIPFSPFSKAMHEIAEDGLLDEEEKLLLAELRKDWTHGASVGTWEQSMDFPMRLWVLDPVQYMEAYNNAIRYLISRELLEGTKLDTLLPKENMDSVFLENHWVLNYRHFGEDMEITLVENAGGTDSFLKQQLYPFAYQSDVIKEFIDTSEIWLETNSTDSIPYLTYDRAGIWLYNTGQETEVKKLKWNWRQLLQPEIREEMERKKYLKVGEEEYFFIAPVDLTALIGSEDHFLSSKQSQELASLLDFMKTAQELQREKGPLDRVDDWVRERLEARRNTPAWLTEMRSKLDF